MPTNGVIRLTKLAIAPAALSPRFGDTPESGALHVDAESRRGRNLDQVARGSQPLVGDAAALEKLRAVQCCGPREACGREQMQRRREREVRIGQAGGEELEATV